MDNPFRKISTKMIGRSAKYYTLKLELEIPWMLQIVDFFSPYIFEILTKQVSWGELCKKGNKNAYLTVIQSVLQREDLVRPGRLQPESICTSIHTKVLVVPQFTTSGRHCPKRDKNEQKSILRHFNVSINITGRYIIQSKHVGFYRHIITMITKLGLTH